VIVIRSKSQSAPPCALQANFLSSRLFGLLGLWTQIKGEKEKDEQTLHRLRLPGPEPSQPLFTSFHFSLFACDCDPEKKWGKV
jgi:hypothetical protein